MSRTYLNLARKPYVNTRPVVRLSLLLWIVGAVFFAGNIWLYWDFLAGRGDTHARLNEVDREIAAARERITQAESELDGFDLVEQNERVEYLNARLERRHFSWSGLFDALTEVLPDDVRLSRLNPSWPEEGRRPTRRGRGGDFGDGRVLLGIDAVARNDESILQMVDALFEDPSFEQPNLVQQTRADNGLIRFDLETIYDLGTPGLEEVAASDDGSASDVRPVAMGAEASAAPEVTR